MEPQKIYTMPKKAAESLYKTKNAGSGEEKPVNPCKKATVLDGFKEGWEEAVARLKQSQIDLGRIKLVKEEK